MDTLERWMRHALALAEKGRGFVEPNPMVGAVVLDSAGQLAGFHALRGIGQVCQCGRKLLLLLMQAF